MSKEIEVFKSWSLVYLKWNVTRWEGQATEKSGLEQWLPLQGALGSLPGTHMEFTLVQSSQPFLVREFLSDVCAHINININISEKAEGSEGRETEDEEHCCARESHREQCAGLRDLRVRGRWHNRVCLSKVSRHQFKENSSWKISTWQLHRDSRS